MNANDVEIFWARVLEHVSYACWRYEHVPGACIDVGLSHREPGIASPDDPCFGIGMSVKIGSVADSVVIDDEHRHFRTIRFSFERDRPLRAPLQVAGPNHNPFSSMHPVFTLSSLAVQVPLLRFDAIGRGASFPYFFRAFLPSSLNVPDSSRCVPVV